VGALLAGTSYEAFSYQIKCLAREVCIWTSWWEILYLALSVASVDAMLIAEAYSCASGKLRRGLIRYAWVNIGVYLAILLIGSQVPVKFLISFELLILVLAPNVILFLILNGWRYARLRNRMDLVLLGVWGWLILTIGAYFLYYLSGMSQRLWAQGIWFTENDVLHIGLILWMVYIALVAARWIKDEPLAI
jgi:urea transporter